MARQKIDPCLPRSGFKITRMLYTLETTKNWCVVHDFCGEAKLIEHMFIHQIVIPFPHFHMSRISKTKLY
jgi:hypothetical protein